MKKIVTSFLLLGLLGTSATFSIQPQEIIGAKAAPTHPLPTSINMTMMDEEDLITYYQPVQGKKGDELVGSLYTIVKGHKEFDYENTEDRVIYKIIDRNWEFSPLTEIELQNYNYNDNPYIRKLYADYNDDINTADRFKNDGASRVSFDREHIWAQSLGNFGRTRGAGSDFHSLLPSDVKGNQVAHSNNNYGVPTGSITNYNSDKETYVGRNGTFGKETSKVFEPLDQYKGDVARAMFYMVARYYEYIDATHPKLQLINGSPNATTASLTQNGEAGDLATLLEWNKLDPVDDYEIKRNNLIYYNYQGNRNPFIDYPEWADIAFDTTYTGDGVTFDRETIKTIKSLDVVLKDNKTFPWLGTLSKDDFIVKVVYEDESTEVIDNYKILINGVDTTSLSNLGATRVTIAYKTFSVDIEIKVAVEPIHYIIGAIGITLTLGILITIVVVLRKSKKAQKKAKKVVKKAVKSATKKHKKSTKKGSK